MFECRPGIRYYNLATDFYEYAWGESFHFCRFAYGEAFDRAIARHEHFLASQVGIKRSEEHTSELQSHS